MRFDGSGSRQSRRMGFRSDFSQPAQHASASKHAFLATDPRLMTCNEREFA
jgi:hypothetical protein